MRNSIPLCLALGAFSVGCFQRPMTLPATPAVLDTPATVGAGETAIGFGSGAAGAVFGPMVTTFGGGVRHGLSDRLELSADGSVYVVNEDSAAGEHPGVYAGRLGLKYQLADHAAVFGGLGAGVAPAVGFFGGLDGGLIVAYENPYAVPYLAGRLALGAPVRPSSVDVGVSGQDEPGEVLVAPARTLTSSVETGVRIPVGAMTASGRRRFDLLGAASVAYLYDGRGGLVEEYDGLWAFGLHLGVDIRLGD